VANVGKKSAVLGLVLLFAGASTLGWGLVEQRKEKQLLKDIKARLEKLDKVTADEVDIRYLADIFSSDDWQQKLDEYNSQRQGKGLLIDTSAVFILTGSAIFTWLLLWLAVRFVYRRLFGFKDSSSEAMHQDDGENLQTQQGKHNIVESQKGETDHQEGEQPLNTKVLVSSGWFDFVKKPSDRDKADRIFSETNLAAQSSSGSSAEGFKNVSVMFSDGQAMGSKKSLKLKGDRLNQRYKSLAKSRIVVEADEDVAKLEKVLKAQSKSLEKQVAEFRQMAKTLKQMTLDRSQPFGDTIKELMQQVSAIREYAMGQQDRIKKLQDGYDWSIIRSFGLKVIRCIDNLEDRIEQFRNNDIETADLEEVRDELIFSLESSGIEQYKLEIDSDYNGQEKIAEAVKEKVGAPEPELKGKIAHLVRPGYRHFIDDENFKVVRTARVKLFG
jgi:hypothetical protein